MRSRFALGLVLLVLQPTSGSAQQQGAVLRAIVEHTVSTNRDFRASGPIVVSAYSLPVEWWAPERRWMPKYQALPSDSLQAHDISAFLSGTQAQVQEADAAVECILNPACPERPSVVLRLSEPLIEGDSAWVGFQHYYRTIRVSREEAHWSIGTVVLKREEDSWRVIEWVTSGIS